MKKKSTILTQEERDILILSARHPGDRHPSNNELAESLGISVTRVKTLIYQACVKLEAQSKYEAIIKAMRKGEINLSEFVSLDEIVEIIRSSSPEMLIGIAQLICQELKQRPLSGKNEIIIRKDIKQDTMLTKRERDVLILVGHGLTNKEIAARLHISIGSVRIFINRAHKKLGARKRADGWIMALKQKEIYLDDIFTLDQVSHSFSPFGVELIEKIVQILSQKLGQEST